ncbi:MAG: type II toxin-antitoxin system RatA family toxin [Rickettsiales bacterium]
MPKIQESKKMQFSAKEIYDLVIDIEKYPEFLPWCSNSHITKIINENQLHADLVINFKSIYEKYTSDVIFKKISDEEFFVEARAIKGPFKSLINQWKIIKIDNNHCLVNFYLEFEFNSLLLSKMLGAIFSSATQKMMQAFENRAIKLYKQHN